MKLNNIPRDMHNELIAMAKSYPVVTLLGPRQSGKSTLVREVFKTKPYLTLENPDERSFALSDPRGFLARFPEGVVLDEIQRAPELLSYIQGIVDEKEQKGFYILTGSHQLALHESITQSLAGRTAILKLLPLSLDELSQENVKFSLDEYLFHGMYPRIYKHGLNPTKFYRDYIQTYVERDVRQMINVKDLTLFQHFLKLCAGRVGQIFNSNSLSNELGVSYHTINNWVSILEASFLVFRLQPYYENFGKRIIKSPKLYFTDVGLATYLLDIHSIDQISRDPLRGGLVENFMIGEFVKVRLNEGYEQSFYFYRDSNQHEIDLIFKTGNNLIPIEIKASKTFHPDFLKGITYFQNLSQGRSPVGVLMYNGDQEQRIGATQIYHFTNVKKAISEIFRKL